MSYLENLTLYLLIEGQNRIIDGACVQNDILLYMPQLHSFTFYISTYIDTRNLSPNLSHEDLQHTLTHIRQQNTTSMVNYPSPLGAECSIFSLPFTFDYLHNLGNIFPNIVFAYVTYLYLNDYYAFRHEFFVRITRSFPLLKYLHIINPSSQAFADLFTSSSNHSQSYSIIEYPHLMSLDVSCSYSDYLEQFLNETKAYVPCLTDLTVNHLQLRMVTKNLTREETRRNCAKVKRLIFFDQWNNSGDYSHYFPSL